MISKHFSCLLCAFLVSSLLEETKSSSLVDFLSNFSAAPASNATSPPATTETTADQHIQNGTKAPGGLVPTTNVSKISPRMANCKPEFRSVRIPRNDSTHIYQPSCVRINQCGGCCANDLLECQPTETTPVAVTVYVSHKKGKFLGERVITIQSHTKCSCQCKIKPSDCKANHEYNADECRCNCKDELMKDKCSEMGSSWLPNECKCGIHPA